MINNHVYAYYNAYIIYYEAKHLNLLFNYLTFLGEETKSYQFLKNKNFRRLCVCGLNGILYSYI